MGLEQLRLFFRFGNISGLFPFRVVLDESSGKIKGFEGHWRHPANWWCAFILFGHLYLLILLVFVIRHMIMGNAQSVPTTYLVALSLFSISFFILITIPRLFLIRIRNLHLSLEIIQQIDCILHKIPSKVPCKFQRRIVFGIVLGFILNISIIISAYPIASIFISFVGFEATVTFQCFLFLLLQQYVTWDLMIHLSYYIISHRLKILSSFIGSIATEPKYNIKINICDGSMLFADQRIKRLRTTGYLFDRLCEAVNELSAAFSLSVLVILSVLMIMSAVCLFFCVNSISFFGENANSAFAAICIWSIIKVLIVLISAESHVTEMKRLREQVFILSASDDLDAKTLMESTALLTSLDATRIQLKAGGLFVVGTHLIPAWIGTVITYLVIFIQSNINNSNEIDPTSPSP